MRNLLELVGLTCLALAGFLWALPVGFATTGVACLVVSWRRGER